MFGSALVFAMMLAIVLAGIGVGGLLAGRLLAHAAGGDRWFPVLALLAGVLTHLTYVAFGSPPGYSSDQPLPALFLSLRLMLPTSLVSGMLFTLLGTTLRRHCGENARAAGWLTLANTTGAMGGALLAGFVLLAVLGIEVSLFLLGLLYGLAAILGWLGMADEARRAVRLPAAVVLLSFGLLAALFPFGLLHSRHIDGRFGQQGALAAHVAAVREGLTETLIYVERSWGGEPHHFQLFTNGHSMSGTDFASARYMRLLRLLGAGRPPGRSQRAADLLRPRHHRPGARGHRPVSRASTSSTSRAISSSMGRTSSRRGTSPLRDPRVRVHVEDGRFFLQTTRRRFDLITGEPPPPRGAGVVNLYSREYFGLVRDRLAPGGRRHLLAAGATRWTRPRAQAITGAFCGVFPDCSLWTGSGLDWMLAGTNGLHGAPSAAEFARQWRDPRAGPRVACDRGRGARAARGAVPRRGPGPQCLGSRFEASRR